MEGYGVERDRVSAMLAAANVPDAGIVQGDAARAPLEIGRFAVVIDPSRRGARGRRFDPEAFSPPWDVGMALAREARAAVVKGPPGIDLSHVPVDAEVEFVQMHKGCGSARCGWGGHHVRIAAQCCCRRGWYRFDRARGGDRDGPARRSCSTWSRVASRRNSWTHRSRTSRPTSRRSTRSRTFEVLEVVPFSVAPSGDAPGTRWRADEIRRRAFPVEPDELRRLLGSMEGSRVSLLCTTLQGRRTVVVARRLDSTENGAGA
jgi:hypothetical protein